MHRWSALIVALSLLSQTALAERAPSQWRARGEGWQHAARRSLKSVPARAGSAYDRAVRVRDLDRSQAAAFPGAAADLATAFADVRDRRFLADPEVSGFLRRPTWLYPDDGCYQRAGWMSRRLNTVFGNGRTWVSKLFAFGDLAVKTRNHPSGAVYWWYHVVTAMSFEGEVRVFDPAIDPSRPLPLDAWLASMSDRPSALKVAICRSGAYSPSSGCDRTSDLSESELRADAREFLRLERARIQRLGRDPQRELGENPPWAR